MTLHKLYSLCSSLSTSGIHLIKLKSVLVPVVRYEQNRCPFEPLISRFHQRKKSYKIEAMLLLFLLPVEIWREDILSLLSLNDIVRTCSACMGRVLQLQLRSLMDGHTLKQDFSVAQDQAKQIHWCLTRNILPCSLTVWKELDVEIASVLSQFCARVTRVTVFYTSQNFNTAHFSRMISLNIYECSLESLGNLRECPNLTTLLLDECPRLTAESLLSSLAGCSKLIEIYIDRCEMVEQSAISCIYRQLKHLVSTQFGGTPERPFNLFSILADCEQAHQESMRSVTTSYCNVCKLGLQRLALYFPRLQKIHLSDSTSNVSDADVDLLCQKCPQLNDITLSHFQHLTSAALKSIAQYLSLLQRLSVAYNHGITDEGLIAIARGCSQLVSLNISHCASITDMAVREMWSNCVLLQSLDLCGCVQVTDEAFSQRVSDTLRVLYASNTIVNGAFIKQMPMAVQLYYNDCPNISSNFVHDIANPNIIEVLHLEATKLSVHDLLMLSTNLPHLQRLRLSFSLANDDVVRSFASNCRYLRSLVVMQCEAVTETTMIELEEQSRKPKLHIIM